MRAQRILEMSVQSGITKSTEHLVNIRREDVGKEILSIIEVGP